MGVTLAIGASVIVSGCGGNDATPEEAFCEAGDNLRASVTGLADLDVISGGTDALRERVDAVASAIDDLRSSGADVAADEVEALDQAVTRLRDPVAGVGEQISLDTGREAIDAVAGVVGSAGGVISALDAACP